MLIDADRIRTMRLDHGWTQEQLAEMCDVSVRTIQRIEKSGVAALDTTNALAAVLRVERTAILVQGGVRPARIEFSPAHVAVLATAFFLLGLGVGALV
jgi:transcriptional regulator with XRE-family HTH domain